MNKNLLIEHDNVFGGNYNHSRLLRICKLEQIFGHDWFKGKSILELGCGYGNVGLYFKDLGADVTFADARQEFLDVVKSKDSSANTLLIDQDKEWNLAKQFDLVIHWGVLYNLNNWQQDLQCTLKHSKFLSLESAVNKYDYDIEFKIVDFDYGKEHIGCFNNMGTLPSISKIENELTGNIKRYDDADLNCSFAKYTLICNDKTMSNIIKIKSWNQNDVYGGRKFWVVDTQKSNNLILEHRR